MRFSIISGAVLLAITTSAAATPLPPRQPGYEAVRAAAIRHRVPVALALAVARVESNFNCRAHGRHGELGPLQIKPATARGLGYRGPVQALQSCGAGVEWGMRHLAAAYRRCGTMAGAARLHQRGLGAACHGASNYVSLVLSRAR